MSTPNYGVIAPVYLDLIDMFRADKRVHMIMTEMYVPGGYGYQYARFIRQTPKRHVDIGDIEDELEIRNVRFLDPLYVIGLASMVDIENYYHIPLFDVDFYKIKTRKSPLSFIKKEVLPVLNNFGVNHVTIIQSSETGFHLVGHELLDKCDYLGAMECIPGKDVKYTHMSLCRGYGTVRMTAAHSKPFLPKLVEVV